MYITANISQLRADVDIACKAANRSTTDVSIIAASKTKPIEMIREAHKNGIRIFGENYIQEFISKAEQLTDIDVEWHFIGHLQTNKVKYLIEHCSLLHSLDREELATALQKKLQQKDRTLDCLIQVNTSGETTKSGISPDNLIELAKNISKLDRIKIKGLMTIAENTDDENAVRQNYQQLKQLSEQLKQLDLPNSEMNILSMGMSSDYKIAIEQGATHIRIGTTIFGSRNS